MATVLNGGRVIHKGNSTGKKLLTFSYNNNGQRKRNPKNCYGGKSTGRCSEVSNGGFNGCPTVDFMGVDQEKWDKAFPNSYKPWWMKDEESTKKIS